jgi:hypothetical protein
MQSRLTLPSTQLIQLRGYNLLAIPGAESLRGRTAVKYKTTGGIQMTSFIFLSTMLAFLMLISMSR